MLSGGTFEDAASEAGLPGDSTHLVNLVRDRQCKALIFRDPVQAEEEMSKTMREIELKIHSTGEAR